MNFTIMSRAASTSLMWVRVGGSVCTVAVYDLNQNSEREGRMSALKLLTER